MPDVGSLALQQAHAVEDGVLTFEPARGAVKRNAWLVLLRMEALSLSSALGARPSAPYSDACPLPPTLRKLSNWPADAWKVSTPAVLAPVDTPRWIVPFCRTWASCLQFRSSASQRRSARVTAGADYCRHERVDRIGTATDRAGHNTGGLGGLLVAADNKAERVVVVHRCNSANHHCRCADRHRICTPPRSHRAPMPGCPLPARWRHRQAHCLLPQEQ